MAVLLVEFQGIKRGAVLPYRVLIGRRSMNHLAIDDPAVSRMHAWICGEADRYYINDAGSRTGTKVNGQRIISRHLLGDEDEITIGPAKLTFLAESRLRPGVNAIDLSSTPKIAAAENGFLFDCPSCNAPLWATPNLAGGTGQCKYCGNGLKVPGRAAKAQPVGRPAAARPAAPRSAAPTALRASPSQAGDALQVSLHRDRFPSPGTPGEGQGEGLQPPLAKKQKSPHPSPLPEYRERENAENEAAPASSTAARRNPEGEQTCGVCQSAISVFEEQTACPCCGLVFHADCWAENYGCSAYGCPQVNALAPPGEHEHAASADPEGSANLETSSTGDAEAGAPARFPWEFLLLAGSVFSALAGALTFGLPSLALVGGTVAYMARTRGGGSGAHRGVVMLSVALAVLGFFAGIPVSWFLYFGGVRL